ncbi:SAP30-binding protein [Drosophila tropicalis]|uniref:SAP30-binding protein n=1 Tax=Drosophila tropicalis TaxID=46794 RepID=UPI0035AB9D53
MAALASLTEQYTDSENEGDVSPDSENSAASQVIIPKRPSPPPTPVKQDGPPPSKKSKKKKRPKKVRRLVSYQDDTLISDEDEDRTQGSPSDESSSSGSMDSESDGENNENRIRDRSTSKVEGEANVPMETDDSANTYYADDRPAESYEKDPKYAKYKFQLPPEPKGKPPPELVNKITKMFSKMQQTNMDMNRVIQDRKEFRNPSIYDKLISFCDINEFGTNYPPEIYDPLQWGDESYFEALSSVQKTEMVKRQKDRKDLDKVEQATALARKVEEEAKKRKSKWDQPASSTSTSVKSTLPALTTTVTGTKGTVISAFGSLPKKPAV